MMRREQPLAAAIMFGLLGAACSKASSDSAAPGASAGATATGAATVQAGAVTGGGGSLDSKIFTCDQVLPSAFHDKLGIAGMKLSSGGKGANGQISCGYIDEKTLHGRNFDFKCHGSPAAASPEKLIITENTFKGMAKDAKVLSGVGRWAIEGTVMSVVELWIYDDKTPCEIDVGYALEKTHPTADYARGVLDAFHAGVLK